MNNIKLGKILLRFIKINIPPFTPLLVYLWCVKFYIMALVSTNFILRTDKINKRGERPIVMTLSVAGSMKKYPTGINVLPENWDPDFKRVIFLNSKTAKQFPHIDLENLPMQHDVIRMNDRLAALKKKVNDIAIGFEVNGKQFTVADIAELLGTEKKLANKLVPSKVLYDFIDKYISDNEGVRAKGSLTVYKSLRKHLQDYEAANRVSLSFDKIDYAFMESFQKFLLNKEIKIGDTKRKLQNTTIAKQLSTLKTFIGYAKKYGIEVNETYKSFEIRKERLDVIALSENEFVKLYNADLSDNIRLQNVRDIFCFGCTTGLRYSDLQSLKWDNIKSNEIRITVTKTKQPLMIPLNGYSSEILARYENNRYPLPRLSSQNFNIYIKELCKLLEIDDDIEIVRFRGGERLVEVIKKYDLISAHVSRKTFCTLSLERGMSAEQVMKVSGHTDYRSFQRYFRVNERIKTIAMYNAWGGPKQINHLKKVGGE